MKRNPRRAGGIRAVEKVAYFPYLSAIIEQDEAPVIIDDYGGFFVSGI